MPEEFAIVISITAIGAAISQLAFRVYRRRSSRKPTDVELTIDLPEDDHTRNICVTPQNIKSVENLLSSISRQSRRNDESTHQ